MPTPLYKSPLLSPVLSADQRVERKHYLVITEQAQQRFTQVAFVLLLSKQTMGRRRVRNRKRQPKPEDLIQQESLHQESLHQGSLRQEGLHQESLHQEGLQQESLQQESLHQESLHQESLPQETLHQERLKHMVIIVYLSRHLVTDSGEGLQPEGLQPEIGRASCRERV